MKRTLLTLMLLVFACGENGQMTAIDVADSHGATADAGLDIPDFGPAPDAAPDLHEEDAADEWVLDLRADETSSLCQPGEGCFLDPCTQGEACLSGWCVDHMGESVCTLQCTEECPPGWSCQQVAGTAPDLVFVCVSDFANLCRPCTTGDNCKSVGGAEDVCVAYGDDGAFCGGGCATDDDCPWGFSCNDTQTTDGIATRQCVADAGECPCTPQAVELALWTSCARTNEFGTCTGKRVCTQDGLTPCSAAEPAEEICDGQDNDCNGEVDDVSCDDDNACTADTCDPATGCTHEPLTGTECSDGDICTLADHCEDGACIGAAINCDDNNPCTDDACNPTGGCVYENNLLPCDDGDPCTVKDTCGDGSCSGYAVACDCQADKDCAALEDGNACNGTLFCDMGQLPYKCTVVSESVVTCPEPDNPCQAAMCDPASGICGLVPAEEGAPCSDANACTAADTCQEGVCTGGPAVNCNDGNPCTTDSCDPVAGCLHTDNALPCNDGDPCTTGDTCQAGACQGTGALGCDDGNPCTNDACQPGTGCVHTANNAPCDDSNACTAGDACAAGTCAGTQSVPCDDANPCTTDSCAPQTGCVYTPNTLACDDGDACTGADVCADGTCAGTLQVACDDGNVCTDDTCDPATGCVHTDNAVPCDDHNTCTTGDVCADGTCAGQGSLECDDGNVCTKDICLPAGGCQHEPVAGPCDDADACTAKDACVDGACVGNGAPNCNDGNPCTDDSCDSQAGCVHTNNTAKCFDGDVCTTGDTCADGQCVPAGTLDCDDSNPCTDDACAPDIGCVHKPNAQPCDDTNACTTNDQCAQGSCLGGAPPDCDDGNVCTTDSCDPANGCVHTLNALPCDDGNVCTVNDQCAAGICEGGEALNCNDGNVCTTDACDPATGCQFTTNQAPCDDGNACTTADTCAQGECIGGPAPDCDDGNVCTDDSCDPATGCAHAANAAPCDDGDACTTVDVCADSTCTGSQPPDCDDGDVCTADSCDPDTGCVHEAQPCCGNNVVDPGEACDDGNHTSGDGCAADCSAVEYVHHNGVGVTWYNNVPTGTINADQAKLSCQQSYGTCYYSTGDCAGPGWCQGQNSGKCWGWTSGCSGGAGRVWQYSSSYTTYGNWN